MHTQKISLCFVAALILAAFARAEIEPGFVPLFDGKTLDGWKLIGKNGAGYGVTNDAIYCARGGGGNLFTEKEFYDFVFRFEFKLDHDSNNGIGIRAPYEGDAAYMGMEIQVIDDNQKKYGAIRLEQHHGAIYDVVAPEIGFQKPIGEWNEEEISAQGRRIKVTLNGHLILDAELNYITDPETLARHPGLLRPRGHIGFLGHDDYVEFRNIRIKELSPPPADNTPPREFTALFNGKNLDGWKGLVENPVKRAKMSAAEMSAAQKIADENMREHWRAENGVLNFDGKGKNLCTATDYANFELWVDWKITPDGDSGIYLRGTPQVQIWDPNSKTGKRDHSVGSGGLHNNVKKENPNTPLKRADQPVGEWNHFQILMIADKVTVYLNNELVVHNTRMENFWEKEFAMYPSGQIELQSHHTPLYFRNIYIRELPRGK